METIERIKTLLKEKNKKASGEFVAFALIAVFLAFVSIFLVAFQQYSYSLDSLSSAVEVTARTVALTKKEDDAKDEAIKIAKKAITNINLSDVSVDVKTVGPDNEWKSGELVKVTVSADVDTMAPYIWGGTVQKSLIVPLEIRKWNYTEEQFRLMCCIVAQECSTNYEGTLAVMSSVINRANQNYGHYGTDPYSQLTAQNGFEYVAYRDSLGIGDHDATYRFKDYDSGAGYIDQNFN